MIAIPASLSGTVQCRLFRDFLALISLSWVLLWPMSAAAHAELTRSEPAANAVLKTAPERCRLFFSRAIEAKFSKLTVQDGQGKTVDKGDVKVVDKDEKALEVTLTPLTAGAYRVIYSAVAQDGHKVKGEFTFVVE